MNGSKVVRLGVCALTLSVFVGALGAVACNASCAPIACIPSVSVAFDRPLTDVGAYSFTITADDTEMSCTASIPSDTAPRCTDERAFVLQSRDGALTGVSVDGTVKTLAVVLTRDHETIGNASFSPKYEALPIGDVGCGTCPLAQEILPISEGGAGDGGVDSGTDSGTLN